MEAYPTVRRRSPTQATNGTPYPNQVVSHVHDALNRLTSVTYPGGLTTTYSYDANGNRATKVTGGVTTTYTYDNAGNQTARGTDTFSWDYANQGELLAVSYWLLAVPSRATDKPILAAGFDRSDHFALGRVGLAPRGSGQ